eukprot:TRINITY_DN367_c0_g3_i1.p1 TRINITY_DN367_c0_g3~~TRINITY_DN367_c0_g3_i1.p1  ORF type:complete len:856 (+),score=164.65 TRINITY_DN367_c0_g3_i1:55-2622(+)
MSKPSLSPSNSFKSLSNLFEFVGLKLEGSDFGPSHFSVSTLNLLAALESKVIEDYPLVPLRFDDTALHADKFARKLLLFSCLKWYMECEREHDLLNFWIYADHYKKHTTQSNLPNLAPFMYSEFIATDSSAELIQGYTHRDRIGAKLGSRDPNLFTEIQDECLRTIKADFYGPIFKHPVFNTFATAVHSVIPALTKNTKEIDSGTMIRKGIYVLSLMEALETFEVKESVEKPTLTTDETVSMLLQTSIRRLLTFPMLKAFVEKEVSLENINFWLAVTDYKHVMDKKTDLAESEKRQMAYHIFEEFIQSESPSEVNIQHNLRMAIESEMKETVSSTLFDKAQREVLQLLHGNSYVRFLKSPEHQEYSEKLKSLPDFYSLDSERRKYDEKFREKFKLPTSERRLVEITCALEGRNMTLHGSLQFSALYACFYATVFGFKTREVILLRDVESLDVTYTSPRELDTDGYIKFITKERTFIFRGFSQIRRAFLTIRKLYKDALRLPASAPILEERLATPRREAEQETMGLTEKDWALFQEGAKVVAFTKDTPILREGERGRNMYQVARGRVRIEKNGQVLRTMEQGQFFGEISFLEGGSASATVIADENPTAVYIIDGHFIEGLLKVEPGLPGRFYNYLALQLSDRLRSRKVSASTAIAEHLQLMTNDRFQKMFGYNKDEELIATVHCSLEKIIRQTGALYVSTNHLSFTAQIMGMKTRDIIPLRSVSTITANEETIEITTDDEREFIFSAVDNMKDAYDAISSTWRTLKVTRNMLARGARPSDASRYGRLADLSQSKEPISLDLKVFLAGARVTTYMKDEVILEEGRFVQSSFQVLILFIFFHITWSKIPLQILSFATL